ncbi:glutaminase A [Allorhodopirellula solitaria]|uniref:Glutaminase n=1 Tax=Allorhodopirellula solitaria TaxID=2527987 RepID=A0A5C5XXH5_9BACT|nr:glutaminase A [Allorhodopirellula solitaria]TWT67063.1 Glutaminase 1 [Allorhodopirellula solitaria]
MLSKLRSRLLVASLATSLSWTAANCAVAQPPATADSSTPTQATTTQEQAADKTVDIGVSLEKLQSLADAAHQKFKDDTDGKNADYIPELAKIPSELFGVCIMTVNGDVITVGDVDYSFAIESVSKPFTLSMLLRDDGYEAVLEKIGVEPTGLPFNSVAAVELHKSAVNPLVNAGAMASVSMVDADSPKARFEKILSYFEEFADDDLTVIDSIYESEAATNWHNKGIAWLLDSYGKLYADPDEVCDVYTKQCSIGVTARQLATMGATLANGGQNPKSGKRLLPTDQVPKLLAIMLSCGFYDGSGQWACEAGLPSKTGVGGGIVSVVPGRFAIVGFSPPLDEHGNSVRAQNAIKYIAEELELSLFNGRN